jgi:hypothetical protein
VLGDWTAHVIVLRRMHLVIGVAERTLLPVLVPGREMSTLLPRFRQAVGELLQAIGVPGAAIDHELDAMSEIVIGRTTSRRVLGSLNDFVHLAEPFLDGRPLLQVALRLAEAPCRPIDMKSPRRATLAAFSASRHAQ